MSDPLARFVAPVDDGDADALLGALLAAFPEGETRWAQIESEYNRLAATSKTRAQLKNRSKKVTPVVAEKHDEKQAVQVVRESCALCNTEVPQQSWLGDFQRLVCCGGQICPACDSARREASQKNGGDGKKSSREKCVACKADLPTSTAESLVHARKHAKKGKAWAQHSLGYRYEVGQDVEVDCAEAVKWFRLAADQGFALSQDALGECYRDGLGVPVNFEEAVKWYRLSADQGYAQAQHALGQLIAQGKGTQANPKEAYSLFCLSAEQGCAEAECDVALALEAGNGVEADAVKAYTYMQRAAEKKFVVAQCNLGRYYMRGIGVTVSKEKAKESLMKAATQGSVDAKELLRELLTAGK
eukprot:TRINITY_DN11517_c1_g2_i1.p1 TRINITY_DN11517_c1_g2~~TRINITY_DN11517_c1_g2_i1.p1  ORF type:complete len:391 (-),score=59.41 TRINITY_DN11517_c1_g2_i1:106-1179(-)